MQMVEGGGNGVSLFEGCVVCNGWKKLEMRWRMLDVYDVEGKVRAALAQKTRIGILGKALGGPAGPRLEASSHTFKSVNRHHCVLLKRQATDRPLPGH